MECRTFFSDETENFIRKRKTAEGKICLHIRLRTGRYQARRVQLLSGEKAWPMHWEEDAQDFDYYGCELCPEELVQGHYFAVETQEGSLFFDRLGVFFGERPARPFAAVPGDFVPAWAKGAVTYQVFPDRFANGCPENDVQTGEYRYMGKPVRKLAWGAPVEPEDTGHFYGGDIQGILDKLDYLKDLGIQTLYVNPIFVSPSSHRYDIADFNHVDRHLGDPAEAYGDTALIRLSKVVHERGMRLLLDGVFNHCSSSHPWMGRQEDGGRTSDGAFANPESPWRNRFVFTDEACTLYECWWDNPTLPKLNYEGDPGLEEEMLATAEKWLSPPFAADGWRLDVAADLGHSPAYNHAFWRKFRQRVKGISEEKLITAEHYAGAESYLEGDQWDTLINFQGFTDPVSYFLTGMEKHSDRFEESLLGNAEAFCSSVKDCLSRMPYPSVLAAMTLLDNHDHSRFLTRTNGLCGRLADKGSRAAEEQLRPEILRQAVFLQMTFPGAPLVYYGDECGLAGFTDPDNRRCFPTENPDRALTDFYKSCIALHNGHSVLQTGSFAFIHAEEGVVAYVRFDGESQIYAVFNASGGERHVSLPFWIGGRAGYLEKDRIRRIACTDRDGADFTEEEVFLHYGMLELTLQEAAACVFSGERAGNA